MKHYYRMWAKPSLRVTLVVLVIVGFAILLPIHSAYAGSNSTSSAAGQTLGWGAIAAGALGIAALAGCVPCGVIALGIGIGGGILTWATSSDPHQIQE